MAQCSPEVYTVAFFLSSGDKLFAAHRAKANSGCCVLSPLATRLCSSFKTSPSSETRIDPNCSSPLSNAISSSSTQRYKCLLSVLFIIENPPIRHLCALSVLYHTYFCVL